MLTWLLLLAACGVVRAESKTPVFSESSSLARAVVYVVDRGARHELRLYRPRYEGSSDELLVRMAAPPQNAFWDESFESFFYRVDTTVFRMRWVSGARAMPVVRDVPDADEVWLDSETGRWRVYQLHVSPAGGSYRARVYERDSDNRWRLLADRPTYGCEAGDYAMCGNEVSAYRRGRRGVFLSDLQNAMRLAPQLAQRGLDFDLEQDNRVRFLRSMRDESVGVELTLSFGDTLHGIAPVSWVDRDRGRTHAIFPTGSPECGRQVSLDEYAGWLLVTAEYTGQCARLVRLTDGEIVWKAPSGASLAAWVPPPRRNEH